MSSGMSAFGTELEIGDGGTPEAFTTVAEASNFSGPDLSLDPLEITHHGSEAPWKEFVGGLLDGGQLSLDVNFIPTDHSHAGDHADSILHTMTNRSVRNFKLTWPDATIWSFAALVIAFSPKAPVDGKLAASITLKIAERPTIALEGL